MDKKKLPFMFLAVAVALAGNFCFAECALAVQTPQASCHAEKSSGCSPSGTGELCCPSFVALQGSRAEISQEAPPHLDMAAPVFVEEIKTAAIWAPIDFAESPPPLRIIPAAHAIHAPPVF